MADIRTTVRGIGGRFQSRVPGTQVGFQINTFGLQKLAEGVTGEGLAAVLLESASIAWQQAVDEWPVWTGASRDSIDLSIQEVGDRFARVILSAGGEKLIADLRNKSHKDYAPFIEFNGTQTAPAGILTGAVIDNQDEIASRNRAGVARLIQELLS